MLIDRVDSGLLMVVIAKKQESEEPKQHKTIVEGTFTESFILLKLDIGRKELLEARATTASNPPWQQDHDLVPSVERSIHPLVVQWMCGVETP